MSFKKLYNQIINEVTLQQEPKTIQNILNEGISSFKYKIPEDKENLLYDFYILTALPLWNIKGNPDNKGRASSLPHRQSEALVTAAEEAQETIVNYLKKQHLNDVLFSISAEFRHILARNKAKELVRFSEEEGLKKEFQKYVVNYNLRSSGQKEFIPGLQKMRTEYDADDKRGYLDSYKAILASFPNRAEFVKFAADAFRKMNWAASYGGEPWAKICDGWLKLYSAKKYEDKIVWIDHIYDLQHNTDTVFNKIKAYSKYGGYSWLGKALDDKRDAGSLFDLVEKASPSVKTFTARVVKASTGQTLESWAKSKDVSASEDFKNDFEKLPNLPEIDLDLDLDSEDPWELKEVPAPPKFSQKINWPGGTWKGGIWKTGTWKKGTWENGIWKDGIWEGGIWKDGIWEGGIWKGGIWENGAWKGGIWKGGTWKTGYIWDPEYKKYVSSEVDPKTYFEIKTKASNDYQSNLDYINNLENKSNK